MIMQKCSQNYDTYDNNIITAVVTAISTSQSSKQIYIYSKPIQLILRNLVAFSIEVWSIK